MVVVGITVAELLPSPCRRKTTSWTCDSVASPQVARCPGQLLGRRERETKQVVRIPGGPCAFPAACAQDSILRECICA